MTVFNKKYTEIINIAAKKDPELEKVLKLMLGKLNEEHKTNCFNGEEFHDDESGVCLENFDYTYNNEQLNESFLIVDIDDLSYMLNLTDFTEGWVDKIQQFKNYEEAYTTERQSTEILNLEIRTQDEGDVVKQFVLEVLNINGKYVLDYYRGYPTHVKDEETYVEEVNSMDSIQKQELYDIAKLDCPIIVGR